MTAQLNSHNLCMAHTWPTHHIQDSYWTKKRVQRVLKRLDLPRAAHLQVGHSLGQRPFIYENVVGSDRWLLGAILSQVECMHFGNGASELLSMEYPALECCCSLETRRQWAAGAMQVITKLICVGLAHK